MQDKNAQDSNFSVRLEKSMRAAGNLSQHALAQKLNTTQSTVRGWLNGSTPRERIFADLANALNVNAHWLRTGDGDMAPWGPKSEVRYLGPVSEIFPNEIPVISWAHAGAATSYEELPAHWQEKIPSLCRGRRAFGLIVEGDSMEPNCKPNDVVNIDPDAELRNGCLVVAKHKDDGVVLRRFSRLEGGRIKLIAYNTLYPSTEHEPREFHWIYPVHSTFRKELL